MKTRSVLGSALAMMGLVACGDGAGSSDGPVTADVAAQMSALEVNQDGSHPLSSDASGDAPEMDHDCSLGGARRRLLAKYDTNQDGKIKGKELDALRADFGDVHLHLHNPVRHFRKEMLRQLYDDNQDGKLEEGERASLESDLEARCEDRKQQLLTKYDTNHDGKLDDGEWKTFEQDLRSRWQTKHAELLAEFDTDHDGQLEPAERDSARQVLGQELQDEWNTQEAAHDSNGDGKLEASERTAFVTDFKLRLFADKP
ncbi:MAG: hypothetical protein JWN04_3898 [Myxococcaceae bacterium]|nr:hypothetical protein [Myxococcaceae bacterium]